MSAIRALEKLDPGGALLPPVAAPVRAYLRQRRDAIRCIVTMLTADEEEGGDGAGASLHAELGNTEGTGEVGGARGGGRLAGQERLAVRLAA